MKPIMTLTAAACAMALTLGLAGCGGGGSSDSTPIATPGKNGGTSSGGGSGGSSGSSETVNAMLTLINNARSMGRSCGSTYYPAAPALKWNDKLAEAATKHSQDMADRNYFAHEAPSPAPYGARAANRVEHFGYTWSWVGENIITGTSDTMKQAQTAMDGWLKSEGHCANLMNPNFTEVGMGFGFSASSTYKNYWTQVFGSPAP